LISAPGASLSAGVAGSLLGAKAPVGSPLLRTPAGVSRLPLQLTMSFNKAKQNKNRFTLFMVESV